MTPEEEERRYAQRRVAVYRIMAWTSANRRTLRRVALAFTLLLIAGVLLVFWAPWAGLLMMFAGVLPLFLIMLVGAAALIHDEIAAVRKRAKDKQ